MLMVGTSKYYYSEDDQYSIGALEDGYWTRAELYRYDPYGKVTILAPDGVTVRTTSIVNNGITFTGRRLDPETGLYYFRNRYYSADLGRFVSRDPLGYVDGMSLYAGYYVPNGVDPWGLSPKIDWSFLLGQVKRVELPSGMLLDLAKLDQTAYDINKKDSYSYWWKTIYMPEDSKRRMDNKWAIPDQDFPGIFNEAFHAWVDQVDCPWFREIFSREAKKIYVKDAEHKAEEAMSETVNDIVGDMIMMKRLPNKKFRWALPQSPQHGGPGEKWEGDPEVNKPISNELYYLVFWVLKFGCKDPCDACAPSCDRDKQIKAWFNATNGGRNPPGVGQIRREESN